ncbi:MAG: leucyl aminopeptidase [Deltaproteobacteria bacterium CG11_big_fil_rev_8_21_14_0_20_42_23]|nr:MAG: leucyl aminopeptidase [Deltaproteobacteria bacterium CG11_big_fil_rev_8_21_14_0_20_42_23]PJC65122.1 MAG: leucyl aminopeptidase [Deltaproteobacteria bacterium CG_4_9_14_0_2_um_filter_42_21]
MNFELKKEHLHTTSADLVVVGCFQDTTPSMQAADGGKNLDKLFDAKLSEILKHSAFGGKLLETQTIYTHKIIRAQNILVIGLGEKEKLCLESLQLLAAQIQREALKLGAKTVALVLEEKKIKKFSAEARLSAMVQGFLLGSYSFNRYKTEQENKPQLTAISFLCSSTKKSLHTAIDTARAIADGITLTRDLINIPSNDLTPTLLAKEAEKVAKRHKLFVDIWDEAKIKKEKMTAHLAVSQASAEKPTFIHLRYKAKNAKASIALVGKGVTFDTGGISLKPPKGMWEMKGDMGGAGTVLGIMEAIAQTKPNVNVDAYIPSAENMPGGKAFKPGDIIRARNQKTIEILSTDAEGRLLLADALDYASDFKHDYIIDFATLTGGAPIALGELYAALLVNDEQLGKKLLASAKATEEYMWKLPLEQKYLKTIQTGPADLMNAGGSRAQTITAGLFLSQFVKDKKWAHLDIAACSDTDKDSLLCPKGGTGALVQSFVHFLHSFSGK